MSFAKEYAEKDPEEIAIQDSSQSLTWDQVDDVLNRCGSALQALDLGPENRVAVFAENSVQTALANLGGLIGGASVVPVNFHLTGDEVNYILQDSGARVLFVGPETWERGVEAVKNSNVHTLISWNVPERDGLVDWIDWLSNSDPAGLDLTVPPKPNLLYTSGTTGRPKGTDLPPTMFAGGESVEEHVQNYKLGFLERSGGEVGKQLVVGPMYHTGPLSATRNLIAGTPSVVLGRFNAEATLEAIAKHKITSCLMVPTHFVRLLALPDDVKANYDISSINAISHTGSKCPVEVKQSMIDWFGPVLLEAYGASEVGSTCMITSEEWLKYPGSVGKALPPFLAKILDDEGNELPPNTEGRLFFEDTTGRGVIYYNDPEKSADAHIAPGVFTLGEIAYMNEDGYVFITDRFSDMVVSGGVNIYPAEAEQVLIEHPAVLDVACIGVPNKEMGEELKALVILKEDQGISPSQESLIAWCREKLSHYKCPRTLEFVNDLGRNTMGKINKRKLRAPYWD